MTPRQLQHGLAGCIVARMTRAQSIIKNLSQDERSALISVGTIRQGATVSPGHDYAVKLLKTRCLIGNGGGLTRLGTIVRDILVRQTEEAMFS